ncbi:MAG: nucleotidyltransferase domain-containing protein [Magnetococcales bacterium]|nr:nucleotidyltransferase domain-containing protein [Magnetococcales bacterium]
MDASIQTSADGLVSEAVARIVREADPEKVILFGSRARGDARADSDVDLLVVASGEIIRQHGRRRLLARFWSAMGRLPFSFDFLLYSPEEVVQWQDSINHVVCRALREGRVVYERS